MENKENKIILEWETKIEEVKDESRLTAMYCFKECCVNQNQEGNEMDEGLRVAVGFVVIFLSLAVGAFVFGCAYKRCEDFLCELIDIMLAVCFGYCGTMFSVGIFLVLGW